MLCKEPARADNYWAAVHEEFRRAIAHQRFTFPEPDSVLATGDGAHHHRFMLELQDVVMSRNPVVFTMKPLLLWRRGWQKCFGIALSSKDNVMLLCLLQSIPKTQAWGVFISTSRTA
jgi:hypothetical protein